MSKRRALPPIWLMGITNAPFGLAGGFCAVIVPDLLAAHGFSAGRIATIAAFILSPGFWAFLVAPILDVFLSRRTYALIFGIGTALAVGFTITHPDHPRLVEAVMMPGFLFAMLYQGAVGGWVGSLIDKRDDGRLGVWFTVSNLGAGGLMMVLAGEMLHRYSASTAAAIVGGVLLLPMLTFAVIPSPSTGHCPASQSFGRFWREAISLIGRREVVTVLLLFCLPCASFALTDILGGTGSDFSASARTVSLLAGIGSAVSGVVGSLLLFPLARRFRLRPVYLGIGIAGAIFTLSLIALPHTPWSFAVAIAGENLFQALAFAASNAITFEVIGPHNPLAATLYTLLVSVTNLPVTYMQYLDGRGYDHGGLTGTYLTDACISITACAMLAWLLMRSTPRTASKPAAPA